MPDSRPGHDGSAGSPSRRVDPTAGPSAGPSRDVVDQPPSVPGASEVPSAASSRAGAPAWLKIAAATVATALVSAFAAALISPERVSSWFGQGSSGDSAARDATSGPPSAVSVEFKRVTSADGAISVEIPELWATTASRFEGEEGMTDATGLALRAGPDPNAYIPISQETAWVGAAARQFPESLDVSASSDVLAAQIEDGLLRRTGFVDSGCAATTEHRLDPGGTWIYGEAIWEGCSNVKGWRLWELHLVSADREEFVSFQIGLPPTTPDAVAQRFVESVVLVPSLLPASTACPEGTSCDQPSG